MTGLLFRRMRGTQRKVARGIVDLWFPPVCCACEGPLAESLPAQPVCEECWSKLPLIDGPACQTCGGPIAAVGNAGRRCPRCVHEPFHFDRVLAVGVYQGLLREWILRTKVRSGVVLTLGLGRTLADRILATSGPIRADVVVPMPTFWLRRWRRGVNGPDLLAECIAQRLGVPLATRLLKRTRKTPLQTSLSPTERRRSPRGTFARRAGYRLNAAHVLLVDDVLTTGGTCSEAARVLKQHGAAEVTVAVLARGIGAT